MRIRATALLVASGIVASARALGVFTVLFGEANPAALKQVVDAPGRQVLDARHAQLSGVSKEIRGYH
jgi:Ca-activated chloride channel homolog